MPLFYLIFSGFFIVVIDVIVAAIKFPLSCCRNKNLQYNMPKSIWQWASTFVLLILTLSKVSFSDILGNDYWDHSDTFEKKTYFYTFGIYTLKNDTLESVWVDDHGLCCCFLLLLSFVYF